MRDELYWLAPRLAAYVALVAAIAGIVWAAAG